MAHTTVSLFGCLESGCGLYEGFFLGALRPLVRVIGLSQSRGAGYTRDAGSTREFTVVLYISPDMGGI